MLSKNEKKVLDCLARAVALESIKVTGRQDYKNFVNYVIHEASYEDIVLTVFDKKYLTEQADPTYGMVGNQFVDTDIERARRLAQVEKALAPIIGLGVAALASGSVDRKLIEPTLQKLGGMKDGARTGAGSVLGTLGGHIAFLSLSMAAGIVVKYMLVLIEKSKSICRSTCKKHYDQNDPDRKIKVDICGSKCKIQGTEYVIGKLRTEIAKCGSTPNPEKCKYNLVKMVGTYNDIIATEREKLKKYAQELRNRQTAYNQTGAN